MFCWERWLSVTAELPPAQNSWAISAASPALRLGGDALWPANGPILFVAGKLVLAWVVAIAQALDGAAIAQMLAHDLVHIFDLHTPIPDAFRIDDDHWAVAALIETAAVIDANRLIQSFGGDTLLEARMDATPIAVHLWAIFAAGADEDVPRPDLAGGLAV